MARSRHGGRRLAGALALVLAAVGAAGCGTFDTGDDEKRAVEVAERVAPGRLAVIGARPLFPEAGGSEVTFRIADDAEAFVRLRVDAEKADCEGRPCEDRLRDALARAGREAADFRVLRREFEACGHPVRGLSADGTGPWVAAPVGAETVRPLVASLGDCLERWARARTRDGGAPPAALSVKVVPPERAAGRAGEDTGRPALLEFTSADRLAALGRGAYHRVSYRFGPGGIDRESAEVGVVRPFEERQRYEKAVRASAQEWLRSRGGLPEAVTADFSTVGSLLPGRVDRFGGWLLFCERPEGERPVCLGRHALAVTAGPDGRLTGEPRVFRDVREGNGPLVLPTAADGAPSYAWGRS
ncbi:SCO7460 family lipoprotein [Streptomyces termitum]|uniref:SCO7460 family lipoprotein n=1 Tax=Streptomyces termitum TaxID=67368 RepID=UPI0037B8F8A4